MKNELNKKKLAIFAFFQYQTEKPVKPNRKPGVTQKPKPKTEWLKPA